MLYKNDQPYEITQKDIAVVYKRFPFLEKKPIRLVYPEERIKKSLSKHNRLPDKPNSISFPLKGIVKSKEKGTEVWRYADSIVHLDNGRKKYSPSNFSYNGIHPMQNSDIELIWFLYTKCPYVKHGWNWNKKTPKAMFEDLPGKAMRLVEKEQEMADVKTLLFSKTLGLSNEKLRMIGKAYFINDVDGYTEAELKILIQNHVMKDKINGASRFMELVGGEKEMETRALIQSAIDKKIIRYLIPKKEWDWVDETGTRIELIAKIPPTSKPQEALYDLFNNDKTFHDNLIRALQGGMYVKEKEDAD